MQETLENQKPRKRGGRAPTKRLDTGTDKKPEYSNGNNHDGENRTTQKPFKKMSALMIPAFGRAGKRVAVAAAIIVPLAVFMVFRSIRAAKRMNAIDKEYADGLSAI